MSSAQMSELDLELQEWCQGLGSTVDRWDEATQKKVDVFQPGEEAASQKRQRRQEARRLKRERRKWRAAMRSSCALLCSAVAACLKGLESLLRRDHSELQPAHFRLGQWHTVRTHLLPLLFTCCRKKELVYDCVKLLARLTMPLSPLVEQRQARLMQLQEYKAWMLEGEYLTTLVWVLSRVLEQHPSVRGDRERHMLEMLLTLFRNLLAVPDPDTNVGEFQKKLHDRCINKMHDALVFGEGSKPAAVA